MRGVLILLWVAAVVAMLLPLLRRLPAAGPARPPRDELVKDPLCQTYVVRSRAIQRTEAGVVRYFCSDACARRFAAGV